MAFVLKKKKKNLPTPASLVKRSKIRSGDDLVA